MKSNRVSEARRADGLTRAVEIAGQGHLRAGAAWRRAIRASRPVVLCEDPGCAVCREIAAVAALRESGCESHGTR
jgi:hypothetical protein